MRTNQRGLFQNCFLTYKSNCRYNYRYTFRSAVQLLNLYHDIITILHNRSTFRLFCQATLLSNKLSLIRRERMYTIDYYTMSSNNYTSCQSIIITPSLRGVTFINIPSLSHACQLTSRQSSDYRGVDRGAMTGIYYFRCGCMVLWIICAFYVQLEVELLIWLG